MNYLKFDKAKLVNTEYSLKREFVRTNRAGSFASSTIINCNTRKYHGLLICPIDNFGGENHVLLSTLDETLIQHGSSFNLGIHKFPGEYSPKGNKYVREYEMEPTSSITYRIGGMVLKKELLLVEKEERILVRYTLLEANSPTILRLQPFLAFRNSHSLTKANLNANTRSETINNGIRIRLYDGFPYLHMQSSKESEFIHVPDWYYNVEYKEEKKNDLECNEDLFVPGYFEMELKKGKSIVFSAGTKEINPRIISRQFNSELKKKINLNSFENCIENAALQFFSKKGKETKIINGFPWFSNSERNTYLALPGLTLARGDKKTFQEVMNTSAARLNNRYLNEEKSDKRAADVPLWFFWSLQKFHESGATTLSIWKKYGKQMKFILDTYLDGKKQFVEVHDNGLLWINRHGSTWMNTKFKDIPVTKRKGYVVEINALWYNAICFALELAKDSKDTEFIDKWKDLPEKIKNSFNEILTYKNGKAVYDYYDEDGGNTRVRPNQLFAASLPYSCLSNKTKKCILDEIERELLTPRGLRTISPNSSIYKGNFKGFEAHRKVAYHQGCAFPWLLGHFAETYLKLHKSGGHALIRKLYDGFESCLSEHGLGTISEIYDGNPPHKPSGATSYALSVAEIIRINKMLE